MAGKGQLQLTGKLGDVMNESARIALSLIRSRAEAFKIPEELFKERDLHLHVPAGAVPKDGPSAGVAMTCALLSLLWRGTGKPARAKTAMTGEITLRGRVLPVGGIKEKLIGARRAGVNRAVLPRKNEPDVLEIPHKIIKGLKIVYVEEIEEAVEAVIGKLPA
jgi:ATP-dependent Lon protease